MAESALGMIASSNFTSWRASGKFVRSRVCELSATGNAYKAICVPSALSPKGSETRRKIAQVGGRLHLLPGQEARN